MSIIARIFVVIGVFATVAGIVAAIASVYDKFENLERIINEKVDETNIEVEQIKERLKFLKRYYCPDEYNQYSFEKVDKINRQVDKIEHDLNGVNGLKFQTCVLENRLNSLNGFTHQVLYGKCNNLIEDLTFTKNEYDRRFKWIFDNILTQKQKDKYNEEFNND